jgi:hypothetical protein
MKQQQWQRSKVLRLTTGEAVQPIGEQLYACGQKVAEQAKVKKKWRRWRSWLKERLTMRSQL